MHLNDLKSQVALGEDSRRQFKRDVTTAAGALGGNGRLHLTLRQRFSVRQLRQLTHFLLR